MCISLNLCSNLRPNGDSVAVTFLTVVMTVFLYYLNTPIIRLLEGYPWAHSVLGRKLKNAQIARYNDVETLLPRLRFLRVQWSGLNERHPKISEIQEHMNILGLVRSPRFPKQAQFGSFPRDWERTAQF